MNSKLKSINCKFIIYIILLCNYNTCYSIEFEKIKDSRIFINKSNEIYICGTKQIYTSNYLIEQNMKETRAGFFEIESITKSKAMSILKIDDEYLLRQRAMPHPPIQYVIMLKDGSYAVMELCDEKYKPRNIRSLIPDDDAIVNLTIVNSLKMNMKLQ